MYQTLAVLILIFSSGFHKILADDSTLEEENTPPHFDVYKSQSYNFRFKTSNGIERNENGVFLPTPFGPIVQGSYSYIRPDGKTEKVSYIADKLGFKVLPKPKLAELPHHPDIILDNDVRIDDAGLDDNTKTGISSDTLASLIGIG